MGKRSQERRTKLSQAVVKDLLEILYYAEQLHRMGVISDTYKERIQNQVNIHLDVFTGLWVKGEE